MGLHFHDCDTVFFRERPSSLMCCPGWTAHQTNIHMLTIYQEHDLVAAPISFLNLLIFLNDRAAGLIVCPINDIDLLFLRKDHLPHE